MPKIRKQQIKNMSDDELGNFVMKKLVELARLLNWGIVFEEDRDEVRGMVIGTQEYISSVLGSRAKFEAKDKH